ncbi:MAG: hypothetical protein IJT36_03880 [Alphaproteobacteria bacterium]|nr:hypothetical protein [Alphaproteobacteria bacterium]
MKIINLIFLNFFCIYSTMASAIPESKSWLDSLNAYTRLGITIYFPSVRFFTSIQPKPTEDLCPVQQYERDMLSLRDSMVLRKNWETTLDKFNYTDVNAEFDKTLKKEFNKLQSDWVHDYHEAQKVSIISSSEISWDEGISLVKSAYHKQSNYNYEPRNLADAVFLIFLQIQPPSIPFFTSIFKSKKAKREQQIEIDMLIFANSLRNAMVRVYNEEGETLPEKLRQVREDISSPSTKPKQD